MIKIYPASELLKLINEKIQLKYPMFNTYATSDEKLHCIKRARLLTTDGKESVSMVFSQAEVDRVLNAVKKVSTANDLKYELIRTFHEAEDCTYYTGRYILSKSNAYVYTRQAYEILKGLNLQAGFTDREHEPVYTAAGVREALRLLEEIRTKRQAEKNEAIRRKAIERQTTKSTTVNTNAPVTATVPVTVSPTETDEKITVTVGAMTLTLTKADATALAEQIINLI